MLPTHVFLRDFIHAFHPRRLTGFALRRPNEAELVISTLEDRRSWCHHWRPYRRRAAMVADYYRLRREVFFSVALHESNGARLLGRLERPSAELPAIRPIADTAIALPALWVTVKPLGGDVHREALPAVAGAMPRPPSCIISTGTGFDLFWLLREPWFLEAGTEQRAASALLRGLRERVRKRVRYRGFEVAEQDLGQLLRVPESFDCDVEPPRPVILEEMNERRYDRRDFEYLLPLPRGVAALPPARRAGGESTGAVEEARRDLVRGLHRLIRGLGGRATAAEILEALAGVDGGSHQGLRVAIYELYPRLQPGELPSARGLANTLRHLRGAVHDDLAVVRWPRSKRGSCWSVERR